MQQDIYVHTRLDRGNNMIHFIICGHGEFAEGLLSGAVLLCGEYPCDAINFSEGTTPEQLREKLHASIARANGEPVLFFTDLIGGTPFRECSAIAQTLPESEVISGANLQMITEGFIDREDATDVKSFAWSLVERSRECMTTLSKELETRTKHVQAQMNDTDDGI